MFYYISVIAFVILSPINLPVEERAVVGPFPEKFQCESYKAQVAAVVDSAFNEEIKTAKCVEQTVS